MVLVNMGFAAGNGRTWPVLRIHEGINIMPTLRINVPFLLDQPRGKKLLWSSK